MSLAYGTPRFPPGLSASLKTGSQRLRQLPAVVYRIYGPDDALLYVGLSGNVAARLSAHRSKPWWSDGVRVETTDYVTRDEAAAAELEAIRTEFPLYNRSDTGGRPKLDDPTVPIAFRMKRSASEWWTARADKEDTTLPKLIRRVLEEKAASKPLHDDAVEPRFKGKK
jgi:predicted GIY-YIG superfamily endonuclease